MKNPETCAHAGKVESMKFGENGKGEVRGHCPDCRSTWFVEVPPRWKRLQKTTGMKHSGATGPRTPEGRARIADAQRARWQRIVAALAQPQQAEQ